MYTQRLFSIVLALLLTLASFGVALAQVPTSGVINSNANIRSGPATTNGVVGRAVEGQAVNIIGCNADCSWYQIADTQWIAAFLVDVTSDPVISPASEVADSATTSVAAARISGNLRSGPGTTYSVVGRTTSGQALDLAGRSAAGDWYQLTNGAWIAAFLVNNAPSNLPIVIVEATRATEPVAVQPAAPTSSPAPIVVATPVPQPAQPSCDPNYAGVCIPLNSADLDCPDIGVRFQRVGSDPHDFDRDNDGIACEAY